MALTEFQGGVLYNICLIINGLWQCQTAVSITKHIMIDQIFLIWQAAAGSLLSYKESFASCTWIVLF